MLATALAAWADDLPGIGATLAAVAGLVAGAELLGQRGVRPEHTRKLVHVVGGGWCLALPWLFTHLASVAGTAVVIAAVFEGGRRAGRLRGLHGVDRSSFGPALFPLGVVGAGLVVWDDPPLFVASVAILTVGDAAAALVGERWGRRAYPVGAQRRSVEGSAALWAIAAVSSATALGATGLSPWHEAVAMGLLLGAVVAALEGVSPMGLDNVAIPVGAALCLAGVRDGALALPAMLVATAAAGAVVAVSLRRGHLTFSGGLATWLLGFALGAGGGAGWFLAAVVVFAVVNVASRVARDRKRFEAKGATRDHAQILANAGLAIPAAVAFAATGHPAFVGAFVGALAFAGADTLASELGVLSRRAPVSITTLRPVDAGVSGGVSLAGYGAAVLGSGLPAFGLALGGDGLSPWLLVGLVAGLVGCTVDSVCGDLWQARHVCGSCGALTEHVVHCGEPVRHASGVVWMDNDAVNLIGSASSAAVGLALVWARGGGG